VCESHEAAPELQRDMKRLSVVGRDYQTDEHAAGYYKA
jgi:hypothetical protein